MATRTQAIQSLLNARTHPDLASLYTHDMECQVNVAQDGGQRTESEFRGKNWHGWTDGIQTWKAIRIPYNASTEPNYDDRPIRFNLAQHAESIGMTGWDWKNRLSRWVAFDFDAISGHSEKHVKKLTDDELAELREILESIPWVTLRRSTSGRGLHLYVFITPTTTKNHTEHAALARAILGKLSALVKRELSSKVDVCGQNMWVWHRKMTVENQGLALLKQGEILTDIPPQWQEHVKVISGHRKKTLPKFFGEDDSPVEQKFEDLTNQITRTPLDDEHKRLLLYLEEHATGSWWDQDHHMLVTHTYWLKKAHTDLGLRGIFETLALGQDAPSDVNCFAFPLRRGAWAVRRYSIGVEERETWEQDGRGWTRCYFNSDPTIISAARLNKGIEDPSGGFVFESTQLAIDAARLLGASIAEVPDALLKQKAHLKIQKDGRLLMEIEGDERGIIGGMHDWLFKSKKWMRLFNVTGPQASYETEGDIYDDLVRHLVTTQGADAGWAIKGEGMEWRREPLMHVTAALHSMGLKQNDIKNVIGNSVVKYWKLVSRPFQPEYPGNRTWNEKAAQLKYVPSQSETLHYPHWKMILDHIGLSLNETVREHPWARNNGITTGSDYLKLWLASLFKEPFEPLPYLFLYGPQNSGKSILYEAVSLLFHRGVVRADVALQNPQAFNKELATAVLCVVEEINLRSDKNAANRIKDWVTAREISIHEKGNTPYQVQNSTHWIQISNEITACPILPGDTRITMIHVPKFEQIEDMIPKKQMLQELEKEAADFLGELISLEMPPSGDRLNIPVLRTAEKSEVEAYNRTPIEAFIAEQCYAIDGHFVNYAKLYEQFLSFLDPMEVGNWTKQKFGRELPPQFPKGRNPKDGAMIVGNISLEKPDPTEKKRVKLRMTPPDKHDNVFLKPEDVL